MKNSIASKIIFGFIFGLIVMSPIAFAQTYKELVKLFTDAGVFDLFLPFLLVFMIFYGLLVRTKVFTDKSGINLFVSLAIAGFVMIYTPAGVTFNKFMADYAAKSIIIILTIAAAIIFGNIAQQSGLLPTPTALTNKWVVSLIVLLIMVAAIYVTLSSLKLLPEIGKIQIGGINWGGINLGRFNINWSGIVILLGFALVALAAYLVYRQTSGTTTAATAVKP